MVNRTGNYGHERSHDMHEALQIFEPMHEDSGYHWPQEQHDTPTYGYEPVVTRRNVSGVFKVLESLSYPLFFQMESVKAIQTNAQRRVSVMWTGVCTRNERDSQYQLILTVMEVVLTSLVDELVRKVKELGGSNASNQLPILIRRTWVTIYPIASKAVEDAVIQYDLDNQGWLGGPKDDDESGIPLWDEEDEARERVLDDLDADLLALRGEIDAWENLLKNGDYQATDFAIGRSEFANKLQSVTRQIVQTTNTYIEGGSVSVAELTAQMSQWEHPQLRRKKKILATLNEEIREAKSAIVPNTSGAMGFPAGGFCFEPSIPVDDRWNTVRFAPWAVTTPAIPVEKRNDPDTRRSVDAFRVFD